MSFKEEFCVLEEKYGGDFNWVSTSSYTYVNELKRELGDEYCLKSITVIAKCGSNDDVLFEIDGNYRIYHLTYSGKPEHIRFLEFASFSEAIDYIEKDYVKNYM